MVTVSISIKKHLIEYISHKYFDAELNAVRFPPSDDLYFLLDHLRQKLPSNKDINEGELTLVIPSPRNGKNPITHNYLNMRSIEIIERKLDTMFKAEFHDYVDERCHREGFMIKDAVYMFMTTFQITGISEDALVKDYYRWRDGVRGKRRKRKYVKMTQKTTVKEC